MNVSEPIGWRSWKWSRNCTGGPGYLEQKRFELG